MSETHFARGTYEQYDEYMELLNTAFGFDDPEDQFPAFLPKLYRPDLEPAVNSFIAFEDGKMIAAVGHFPVDHVVGDEVVKSIGIGNVACLEEVRGRGHMSRLLKLSLQDMIENGVGFAWLGGDKMRYGHFSYEPAALTHYIVINKRSLSHTIGGMDTNYTVVEVQPTDNEYLDFIHELFNAQPYHTIRDRAELYNILCSWNYRPFILKDSDGNLVGYADRNGGNVSELIFTDTAHVLDGVRALLATCDSVSIRIPEHHHEYIAILEKVSAELVLSTGEMFTVLDFEGVVRAYLKLKNTYAKLGDGKFTALIHGYARDEQLTFEVKDGVVSVIKTDVAPDIELDHYEAMRFFFAPFSAKRISGPAPARDWFPAPLFTYGADNV